MPEEHYTSYSQLELTALDNILNYQWELSRTEAVQHRYVHSNYKKHQKYSEILQAFSSDHCEICNPEVKPSKEYKKFIAELEAASIGIVKNKTVNLYLGFLLREDKPYVYKNTIQYFLEQLAINPFPANPSDLARPLLKLKARGQRFATVKFAGIQLQPLLSKEVRKDLYNEVDQEVQCLEQREEGTSTTQRLISKFFPSGRATTPNKPTGSSVIRRSSSPHLTSAEPSNTGYLADSDSEDETRSLYLTPVPQDHDTPTNQEIVDPGVNTKGKGRVNYISLEDDQETPNPKAKPETSTKPILGQ